jgi:hypothetical protein
VQGVLDKLNTPTAFGVALALVVSVNAFLFYHQDSGRERIAGVARPVVHAGPSPIEYERPPLPVETSSQEKSEAVADRAVADPARQGIVGLTAAEGPRSTDGDLRESSPIQEADQRSQPAPVPEGGDPAEEVPAEEVPAEEVPMRAGSHDGVSPSEGLRATASVVLTVRQSEGSSVRKSPPPSPATKPATKPGSSIPKKSGGARRASPGTKKSVGIDLPPIPTTPSARQMSPVPER